MVVRKIVYIDMDASVEQRDHPQWRGQPIIVAWQGNRSVVCSASYEARQFGVRSAMPALRAQRLCPEAIFVPPDFPRYRAVSQHVREIFHRHTDLVEPLSLDEAYLDVTDNKTGLPSATEVARTIREQIREELQLTASADVADAPHFADSEVLTLAWLPGCPGVASLKQTYRLVAANYRSALPRLCSYQQWIARLHALAGVISALLQAATQRLNGSTAFYLLDAKPLPVCHSVRHRRVRLLREEGAWFGKTSKGWFFGFKLHVLRHLDGRMVNLVLTPGNWDDRAPVPALLEAVEGGVALGDRDKQRAAEWAEEAGLLVLTRADAPEKKRLLAQVRQGVETSFSQLWYKFLDRVFSRSRGGLWNTVPLKVVYYNLRQAGFLSARLNQYWS